MKYGNAANRRAQAKANLLIGQKAFVAKRGKLFLVGELRGVADFRVMGASDKSWRRAFESAGVFDPSQKKRSRI